MQATRSNSKELEHSNALMMNSTQKRLASRLLSTVGIALFLCVLAALPAAAQSTRRPRRESNANRKARIARTIAETYSHRWEAAGGGGYERFRSGQFQQRDNQVTFWASTTYQFTPKVGVIGEVRGGYGSAKLTQPLPCTTCFLGFKPQISDYSFMAGPSYRFIRKEKFAATVFAEGGVGIGKFDGASKGFTSADIGVWNATSAANFTAGVNLDYNLYPNLAFRVTPNYLGSTYAGTLQNNKGINLGVVYRFGQIK
jgi:hypothetical protein